jgi:hypothetical protein
MSLSGPRADAFPRARDFYDRSRAGWLPQFAEQLVVIRDGALVGFFPDERSACLNTDMTRDDTFAFLVEASEVEDAKLRNCMADDWVFICEPFLDTDDPDGVWKATRILELRGYSRMRIRLLRALALSGLLWNGFWGEWEHLDLGHVLLGWSLNCALVGPFIGALTWFTLGPLWGILSVATVLIGATLFARAANRVVYSNSQPSA